MDEPGVTRSVHLSSSLHFDSLAEYRAAGNGKPVLPGQTATGMDNGYGLQGNPTLHELQDVVSKLEKGTDTLLYPSGSTALCALAALLKTGDHWLLPDNVYGPMLRFAEYQKQQYGVEVDYYDPSSIDSIVVKPETKLIHIETPGSATFETVDVEAIVKLAKSKHVLTSADNTWASGVLYRPLEHGVDISILSLTKYCAGYSDVFMGSLTIKDPELFKIFAWQHRVLGYSVSPEAAMLVSRGLESERARLKAHGEAANQLVASIKGNSKVTKIYQAGNNDDMAGPNGLFSVELDRVYRDDELEKAFAVLKTFKIGESWGGTRSLVLPFQPEEFKQRATVPTGTVIRFHTGLEGPELLAEDITNFIKNLL